MGSGHKVSIRLLCAPLTENHSVRSRNPVYGILEPRLEILFGKMAHFHVFKKIQETILNDKSNDDLGRSDS